jgi:hypothetical protein
MINAFSFLYKKRLATGSLFVAGLLMMAVACNKPFPDTLEEQGGDDLAGNGNVQPKVLLIVVDGARGEALKYAAAPNLTTIADNAIYTANGLADYERNDLPFSNENAWANLLTGVSQTKHKVTGNDFTGNEFASYPSLFTRLKAERPTLRTAAFVTSAGLRNSLLSDATVAQNLADDGAVKSAALNELKNPDAGIVMAQFNGVQLAGEQFGYGNTVTEYLNALRQVDTYIGELRAELNKRPSSERWLLIVASSKGGTITDPRTDITAYGDTRRNTFIFFYYPKFAIKPLEKPADSRGAGTFRGTYVSLYGIPTSTTIPGVQAVVQNSAAGNTLPYTPTELDVVNAYTVEAKVKLFRGANNAAPTSNIPFFSKTPQRSSSGANSGWAFRTGGNNEIWLWFRSDNSNTALRKGTEFLVGRITDNNWHTLAATFTVSGGTAVAKAYLDGIEVASGNLTGLAAGESLVSTSPLRFGFNDNAFVANGYVNTAFADVRVWNDALPANVIYQYSCLPGLPPVSHPFRNKLVGFWSCRDGSGTTNTLTDESGKGRHATVSGTGTIQWLPFSELNNNICPEPESEFFRKVPNSVDIPYQIYRWLGINNTNAWGLDGKIWITSYEGL